MSLVYIHKSNKTGEVFYVGISDSDNRAYIKTGRNKLWELISKRHGYTVEIIKRNIRRTEAEKIEIELIKKYGKIINNNGGRLCNMADGGGVIFTAESKPKKSIQQINKETHKDSILTAIKHDGILVDKRGNRRNTILCKCKCGNTVHITNKDLRSGNKKSCGCLLILSRANNATSLKELQLTKVANTLLTPISFSDSRIIKGIPQRMIKCKCRCGNITIIPVWCFKKGHTKSCGCLFRSSLLKRITKYYPSVPELHRKYKKMIEHCYSKNSSGFKNCGGRGITVCKKWRESYQNFLDWALNNGWKQNMALVRRNHTSLMYSPNKCCFVDRKEALSRKRFPYRNKKIQYA